MVVDCRQKTKSCRIYKKSDPLPQTNWKHLKWFHRNLNPGKSLIGMFYTLFIENGKFYTNKVLTQICFFTTNYVINIWILYIWPAFFFNLISYRKWKYICQKWWPFSNIIKIVISKVNALNELKLFWALLSRDSGWNVSMLPFGGICVPRLKAQLKSTTTTGL